MFVLVKIVKVLQYGNTEFNLKGKITMNSIVLSGVLKDIQHSHEIDGINFDKAKLIVKRATGQEDVINLRFKSFCNKYKDNDEITLTGNVRSYSYKVAEDKNKVLIYVFTYFDEPQVTDELLESTNVVKLDGRICKINELRTNKDGKHNIHFIVANNLISADKSKRLNSYIPCIAWGTLARELSKLKVNTKINIDGELHSREHKKVYPDGEVEFRVAHELLVKGFEVVA